MKKWIKRIVGLFTALLALWFGLQAARHRGKQEALERKAVDLEVKTGESVGRAKVARDEAKAAKHAAHAALAKGRAKTETLKETTDADFAARIARLNQRMRGG